MKKLFSSFILFAFSLAVSANPNWTIDQPMETIPDTPLTGSIFGKSYTQGNIEVSGHTMTIRSVEKIGYWPEMEVVIFVGQPILEGKTYTVTTSQEDLPPHVHMKTIRKTRDRHSQFMFVDEYSMKLEITEIKDRKVKGKLHLSMPDYKQSYLVGTFTADKK